MELYHATYKARIPSIKFESPSEDVKKYVITEDFFEDYLNKKQIMQEIA